MKKNNFWYTLTELIVIIAIIWILAVWASRINFNPQIDKQNSELFINNIFTSIESVRNNSLLWKWVLSWSILVHPEKWIVSVSTNNSWSINSKIKNGATTTINTDFSVNFINSFANIKELTCKNLDWTNSSSWITNIDLEFSWNELSLSWCNSPEQRVLEITTKYKNFENIININSTTWLIQKIKN